MNTTILERFARWTAIYCNKQWYRLTSIAKDNISAWYGAVDNPEEIPDTETVELELLKRGRGSAGTGKFQTLLIRDLVYTLKAYEEEASK